MEEILSSDNPEREYIKKIDESFMKRIGNLSLLHLVLMYRFLSLY